MEFLLIATAHFLALLSPGPDFFLIVQASLRLPLRYAMAVCLGIAVANGVYLLFAVSGLELIRQMSWLSTILRYLGAGYLLFVGVMLLRAPAQSLDQEENTTFLRVKSMKRQFFIGFMSAILNPKNAIFYLSLFTVMVSPRTGLVIRCLYAIWMMAVVFAWDCLVATAMANSMGKRLFGGSIYYLEKFSGAALALFGILLLSV